MQPTVTRRTGRIGIASFSDIASAILTLIECCAVLASVKTADTRAAILHELAELVSGLNVVSSREPSQTRCPT